MDRRSRHPRLKLVPKQAIAALVLTRHSNIAALLLGLLSATGFAPLQLWPLTLISFALFLFVVERAESRNGALVRGWWFGMGHFTAGLNWIAQDRKSPRLNSRH